MKLYEALEMLSKDETLRFEKKNTGWVLYSKGGFLRIEMVGRNGQVIDDISGEFNGKHLANDFYTWELVDSLNRRDKKMKLIIGEPYKVGNTVAVLREVKAEIQTLFIYDKPEIEDIKHMCLMVNEDGFEKWVYREKLSAVR